MITSRNRQIWAWKWSLMKQLVNFNFISCYLSKIKLFKGFSSYDSTNKCMCLKHTVYQDTCVATSSFYFSVTSCFLKLEDWAEQLSQTSLCVLILTEGHWQRMGKTGLQQVAQSTNQLKFLVIEDKLNWRRGISLLFMLIESCTSKHWRKQNDSCRVLIFGSTARFDVIGY